MLMWETQLFIASEKGWYAEAVMESYFPMSSATRMGHLSAFMFVGPIWTSKTYFCCKYCQKVHRLITWAFWFLGEAEAQTQVCALDTASTAGAFSAQMMLKQEASPLPSRGYLGFPRERVAVCKLTRDGSAL